MGCQPQALPNPPEGCASRRSGARIVRMDKQSASSTLGALRIVIGLVSWVAPNIAGRLFGLDVKNNPQAPYLARLFGIRDLVMGIATLTTSGETQASWLRPASLRRRRHGCCAARRQRRLPADGHDRDAHRPRRRSHCARRRGTPGRGPDSGLGPHRGPHDVDGCGGAPSRCVNDEGALGDEDLEPVDDRRSRRAGAGRRARFRLRRRPGRRPSRRRPGPPAAR